MHPVSMPERVRETLRGFPAEIRQKLGLILYQVQQGQTPGMPHVRPMPSVGRGVSEIRVKDATGAYRAFFLIVTERGIVVFHAFQKKSEQTSEAEMNLARKRLKEIAT